jgi:ABC-type ATPase involved in cell division
MPVALELRGVCKRFVAGTGACVAHARALRDVTLTVAAGEAVAIVGAVGAGKSTLLLCAAGLLAPESGEVRWFGDGSRSVASRRVVWHLAERSPPMERRDGALIHLLDAPPDAGDVDRLASWVEARCALGEAVVVATRNEQLARRVAPNVVTKRRGQLMPAARARRRVAECARRY